MFRTFFALTIFAAGCGAPSVNAADDLTALSPEAAKADALALRGAFEIDATRLRADDLVYVNLLADGRWVWERCYDTPCSQLIAQDGTYSLYKNSSGQKYIKFFMTHVDPPAPPTPKMGPGGPAVTPAAPSPGDLAFVYAYSLRANKLRLRKANTSRTFTLLAFSDEAACNESGGTFAAGACDCSALGTGAFNTAAYLQPGLGGCTLIPNSSEALCDDTHGAYRDDENNLVGTYCECGVGRYFADGAGCTAVP